MTDATKQTTECPHCGRALPSTASRAYAEGSWRRAVLQQTPRSVWDAYEADGIGLATALTMEAAYAN